MSRIARHHRRGMTLVELLVVIAVGTLLLAVLLPLMRAPLEGRKVREASREVTAFFERAKARALDLNRPVGVWIERRAASGDDAFLSNQLFLAETPPLYAGDLVEARCTVARATDQNGVPISLPDGTPVFLARFEDVAADPNNNNPARSFSQSLPSLITPGDRIRFNYRGLWHNIVLVSLDNNGIPFVRFTANPNGPGPLLGSRRVPFQILRQPVKATNIPIDLPNGTVIDLSVSGVGHSGIQFQAASPDGDPVNALDDKPVILMFEPSGAMERIYRGVFLQPNDPQPVLQPITPQGTVHLMVGQIDQVVPNDVFTNTDDLRANLLDPTSLWVSVGHRSGKVTASENVNIENVAGTAAERLFAAREFGRTSQQMGGK